MLEHYISILGDSNHLGLYTTPGELSILFGVVQEMHDAHADEIRELKLELKHVRGQLTHCQVALDSIDASQSL